MIEKHLLEELLGIAVSTGADFAEVFAQRERVGLIRLVSSKIEAVKDNLISGVGIRAFVGTKTYYASTSDTSREGLLRCAAAVAGAYVGYKIAFRSDPERQAAIEDIPEGELFDQLREEMLKLAGADKLLKIVRTKDPTP